MMALRDAPRVPLYALFYLAHGVSFVVPRNRRIWLFDEWQGMRCADNARYLFSYVHAHQAHITAVWISHSPALIAELRAQGFKAYHAYSLGGLWYTFRAKTIIFESTVSVFFWLTGGMVFVNLWHGIPIKKIVYDSARTKKENWVYAATGLRRLYHAFFQPEKIALGEYVLAQAPLWKPIFSSAFRLPPEKVIVENQPRNVALLASHRDTLVLESEREWLHDIASKRERKIITYLPTFRDGVLDPLQGSGIDFPALDNLLAKCEAHMYIKAHHEKVITGGTGRYGNITFVPAELGALQMLRNTDILLTDYSSIFFEFLLTDRPIIFFPFDLHVYQGGMRDMYFEYDAITPGPKARTFEALCHEIEVAIHGKDAYTDARAKARDVAFSPNPEVAPEKVFRRISAILA